MTYRLLQPLSMETSGTKSREPIAHPSKWGPKKTCPLSRGGIIDRYLKSLHWERRSVGDHRDKLYERNPREMWVLFIALGPERTACIIGFQIVILAWEKSLCSCRGSILMVCHRTLSPSETNFYYCKDFKRAPKSEYPSPVCAQQMLNLGVSERIANNSTS